LSAFLYPNDPGDEDGGLLGCDGRDRFLPGGLCRSRDRYFPARERVSAAIAFVPAGILFPPAGMASFPAGIVFRSGRRSRCRRLPEVERRISDGLLEFQQGG
jgi:hypothetical protein